MMRAAHHRCTVTMSKRPPGSHQVYTTDRICGRLARADAGRAGIPSLSQQILPWANRTPSFANALVALGFPGGA